MSATAMRDGALTIEGVPVFRPSAEPRPNAQYPDDPHFGRLFDYGTFDSSALIMPGRQARMMTVRFDADRRW
jgi:hypothetical protein